MRRSRAVAVGVAGALVLATGGVVALDAVGVVDLPGDLWSGSAGGGSSADTGPLAVEPPPGLALPGPGPERPVLAAAQGPRVDPGAVRAALSPVLADPDLGRHAGVLVRDLTRDRPVVALGDADPYVPASTLKLFTSSAVLAALGPDHRFTTSVVGASAAGRDTPSVVLVGGGDPFLASSPAAADDLGVPAGATLTQLAAETVRSLRADGVRRVRIGYDADLFTGPAVAPSWEDDYVPGDIVSPVSALWVEEGRVGPTEVERSTDPAAAAAAVFVAALEDRGIVVRGEVGSRPAPASGDVLAEAVSAPLDTVVEHVLEVSDNEGAEVLLRHVGLGTDRAGSFAGGAAGTRELLSGLGVPYAGVRTFDGSGLSRADRVTREALVQVLQLGADPDLADLRMVTAGLPVARFTGSLASRFLLPDATTGRGVVRAKTGTLSRVHGLAGTVVTREGTLLGFALLTDAVPLRDTLDARALLDELAAALARCGCSR